MDSVEVKTGELIGAALDWAVALAVDAPIRILSADNIDEKWQIQNKWNFQGPFWPSQDWAQCGPMIERYKVIVVYHNGPDRTPMACLQNNHPDLMSGPTVLIAACRAIVYARLGETVSIPAGIRAK